MKIVRTTGGPGRPWRAVAAGSLALLTLAACGSGGGGTSADGGLPQTIRIVSVNPETGPTSFAGLGAEEGYKVATKEINDTRFFGDSTLSVTYEDDKGEPVTAANKLSAAVSDRSVPAVFGSIATPSALAMSPIAQKAGLPIIYTQAGSDGVVVGDYTWRATPLMISFYPIMKKFVAEQGWKSLGIIYTTSSPTLIKIGSTVLPDLAKELGISVVGSVGTTPTTQDFSAPIAQILGAKPDGVAVIQTGASNVTAMTQLRQAGYTGPVLGNSGAGAGNLTPAGANGAGMVWPTDFSSLVSSPGSEKFSGLYRQMFGKEPTNYAAEAYDAAWFVARAIKAAGSTDRAKVKDAMVAAGKEPMSGALGDQLRWVDGTLQAPGVVVEWTGTAEKLLYNGKDV
ncbi:ABC transporter substrate-binding protein [Pseudonocardia ailaonensis]|uniref:ABC transporter substrate-binding protein n=1 Tax=Pseudonocardia ailaonensis TaxID=367279 RepID=A0ABN2N5D3_9PSEU